MKKYIFLCIVCITGMLGPPLMAQNVTYDTTIIYEVDSNRVLQREFCVRRSDFPLPIDANITPVDSILPNALTNKEIITLAEHPGKIFEKKERISKKGEHGEGIGIIIYEFFYEPYQVKTFQFICTDNDVHELNASTSDIKHEFKWGYVLLIIVAIAIIILVICFWQRIKDVIGRINHH